MKKMMMRFVLSLLVLSLTATAAFAKPARRAKADPGARARVEAPAPAKITSIVVKTNAAYSVDTDAEAGGCWSCHFMYGAFYPGTNLTEDIKFAACKAKYC